MFQIYSNFQINLLQFNWRHRGKRICAFKMKIYLQRNNVKTFYETYKTKMKNDKEPLIWQSYEQKNKGKFI